LFILKIQGPSHVGEIRFCVSTTNSPAGEPKT
jgi:hypothetical protein